MAARRHPNAGSPIAPLVPDFGSRPIDAPEPPDTDISVAGMSQADKNAIWRHVKAHHPEHLAFLTDPIVRDLVAKGASPVFPRELVRAALRNRNTPTQETP